MGDAFAHAPLLRNLRLSVSDYSQSLGVRSIMWSQITHFELFTYDILVVHDILSYPPNITWLKLYFAGRLSCPDQHTSPYNHTSGILNIDGGDGEFEFFLNHLAAPALCTLILRKS